MGLIQKALQAAEDKRWEDIRKELLSQQKRDREAKQGLKRALQNFAGIHVEPTGPEFIRGKLKYTSAEWGERLLIKVAWIDDLREGEDELLKLPRIGQFSFGRYTELSDLGNWLEAVMALPSVKMSHYLMERETQPQTVPAAPTRQVRFTYLDESQLNSETRPFEVVPGSAFWAEQYGAHILVEYKDLPETDPDFREVGE